MHPGTFLTVPLLQNPVTKLSQATLSPKPHAAGLFAHPSLTNFDCNNPPGATTRGGTGGIGLLGDFPKLTVLFHFKNVFHLACTCPDFYALTQATCSWCNTTLPPPKYPLSFQLLTCTLPCLLPTTARRQPSHKILRSSQNPATFHPSLYEEFLM